MCLSFPMTSPCPLLYPLAMLTCMHASPLIILMSFSLQPTPHIPELPYFTEKIRRNFTWVTDPSISLAPSPVTVGEWFVPIEDQPLPAQSPPPSLLSNGPRKSLAPFSSVGHSHPSMVF